MTVQPECYFIIMLVCSLVEPHPDPRDRAGYVRRHTDSFFEGVTLVNYQIVVVSCITYDHMIRAYIQEPLMNHD